MFCKYKIRFAAIIIFLNIYNICSASQSDTLNLSKWFFKFTGPDSGTHFFHGKFPKDEFEQVNIPHSFNLKESLGFHRVGFGIYICEFDLLIKNEKDYYLECSNICLRANIYINGQFVGKSSFPYLPYKIKINNYLKSKEKNFISIQVDNRLYENDIPDKNCDGWWIYGGITGKIRIFQAPSNKLTSVGINTFYLSDNKFKITIQFKKSENIPDSCLLDITNKEFSFKAQFKIKKTLQPCTLIVNGIRSWSPDEPILYNFNFTPYWGKKIESTFSVKRGFSQLYAIGNELYLNGKKIFLRGFGRHDILENVGPLLSREQRLADLFAIKNANANMLRIAHYPQAYDIYELCDSIGLIVMDEIPVWQMETSFLITQLAQQKASDYMKNMIEAHGNFTCIGIWSIGNEFRSDKASVGDFVKHVVQTVRQNDPSRLVTYASYLYQFDKAYEYVDLISVNEYFGWYFGSVELLPQLFQLISKEYPKKPMIVSEFGASSAIGIRDSNITLAGPIKSMITKDFSEDYQALFHEKQIKTIWANRKICSGSVVWCFGDFMENRKKPNPKILNAGINGMGILTIDRKVKMSYSVIKNEFGKIKNEMSRINGY